MNFKEPEGEIERWLEKLQEYDFQILHNIVVVDLYHVFQCGNQHSEQLLVSTIPLQTSSELQQRDPTIQLVF